MGLQSSAQVFLGSQQGIKAALEDQFGIEELTFFQRPSIHISLYMLNKTENIFGGVFSAICIRLETLYSQKTRSMCVHMHTYTHIYMGSKWAAKS